MESNVFNSHSLFWKTMSHMNEPVFLLLHYEENTLVLTFRFLRKHPHPNFNFLINLQLTYVLAYVYKDNSQLFSEERTVVFDVILFSLFSI